MVWPRTSAYCRAIRHRPDDREGVLGGERQAHRDAAARGELERRPAQPDRRDPVVHPSAGRAGGSRTTLPSPSIVPQPRGRGAASGHVGLVARRRGSCDRSGRPTRSGRGTTSRPGVAGKAAVREERGPLARRHGRAAAARPLVGALSDDLAAHRQRDQLLWTTLPSKTARSTPIDEPELRPRQQRARPHPTDRPVVDARHRREHECARAVAEARSAPREVSPELVGRLADDRPADRAS